MIQSLCRRLLRIAGWTVRLGVPEFPKTIICVAPHTSNWDFILGELAIRSVGRSAGFLMKKAWFFWPLGCFFRSIGGVAVGHEPGRSLVEQLIDRFKSATTLRIAITPEGTRSRQPNWHTGFLRVAYATGVPICLTAIDFKTKTIILEKVFEPTGNIDEDMKAVKSYYAPFEGKYPEKFTIE